MLKNNEKNSKIKKTIVVQTIIAFSLCVILFILLIFQFNNLWQLKSEEKALNEQIQALQSQNAKYSDQLDYYLSDYYLEDIAHKHHKYDPNKEYII